MCNQAQTSFKTCYSFKTCDSYKNVSHSCEFEFYKRINYYFLKKFFLTAFF